MILVDFDLTWDAEQVTCNPQESKAIEWTILESRTRNPGHAIVRQISEQDPGFLGVSFMFSALVQTQTAAFIGAKLDFRTTALVVEQCSSDCGQIERTEQVSVLPPFWRPLAYRERMQRLYKAVWGGNAPHKLVVAYRVPAFDLANQLCGPAVRTAFG